MKHSVKIMILVISLLLPACSRAATPAPGVEVVGKQVTITGGSYTDVSPAELDTLLGNKDFTLVNVHIPFEGNIAKTDLSIPYDQVAQNLDKLPEKQASIVLYCRSGRMSAIAAETLVNLGYTNIFNLAGGMAGWEQAGYAIER